MKDSSSLHSDRSLIGVSLVCLAIAIAAPYVAAIISDQTSFLSLPLFAPIWAQIGLPIVVAILLVLGWRIAQTTPNGVMRFLWAGLALLLIAALVADSPLPGAGTVRIAQIGQQERIDFPFYEGGAIAIATGLFQIVSLAQDNATTAAIWSWRLLAAISLLATIALSFRLIRLVQLPPEQRGVSQFAVVMCASPLLLFPAAPELLLIPLTLALVVAALTYLNSPRKEVLLLCWLIALSAICLHWTALAALPALVSLSIARSDRPHGVGIVASIAALLLLLATLYYLANVSYWPMTQFLVWPDGRTPFVDYHLFSPRHLIDFGSLLVLCLPALAVLFVVWSVSDNEMNRVVLFLSLLAAGSLIVLFVRQPTSGLVLDGPVFLLGCFPVLLAAVSGLIVTHQRAKRSWHATALAALAITAAPFGTLAVAQTFDWYEAAVAAYADEQPSVARVSVLSLRDAAFAASKLEQANYWQAQLPLRADDFLIFRGCSDLLLQGDRSGALADLYRLIARFPFWTEPRLLVVTAHQQLGQLAKARTQLDSCLLLAPTVKEHVIADYRLAVSENRLAFAQDRIEEARRWFRSDRIVAADQARLWLAIGNDEAALQLADSLIAVDSTIGPAWGIKAEIALSKRQDAQARTYLEQYLSHTSIPAERTLIEEQIRTLNARDYQN